MTTFSIAYLSAAILKFSWKHMNGRFAESMGFAERNWDFILFAFLRKICANCMDAACNFSCTRNMMHRKIVGLSLRSRSCVPFKYGLHGY